MKLVVFNRDLFTPDDLETPVFKEGVEYEVLDEHRDVIFVQSKPNSIECSAFPKDEEGLLFEYKYK